MAHEQSETIQRQDGQWINVHGRTRHPLPPRFPFERESYATREEAVAAAVRRSAEFDRNPDLKDDDEENEPQSARTLRPDARALARSPRLLPLEDVIQAAREDDGRDPQSPLTEDDLRRGAERLLQRLQGPMFPLPGAARVVPRTLTDFAPLMRQVEGDFPAAPPERPRPLELVTSRESKVLDEDPRLEALLRLLEEAPSGSTALTGLHPLARALGR